MCFVVIVLGKPVYFFSPLPLSTSRLTVKTFVEKKTRSVITEVTKLDVVSDGLLQIRYSISAKMRAWSFLGVTHPLLLSLSI